MQVNPFAEVKPVGIKRKGKPKLRVNATRTFLAALHADNSKEATAVLTALTLGLRASEVVKRTVEDLDDDGRLLWIRESKTENSDREIEVPSFLRERLLELSAGKGPADHYWTVKFCERAGVPRVTPHGLRGSGATNRVRGGNSVEDVAAWLGHGDDGATAKAHYIGGGAMESARGRAIEQLNAAPANESTPVTQTIDEVSTDGPARDTRALASGRC